MCVVFFFSTEEAFNSFAYENQILGSFSKLKIYFFCRKKPKTFDDIIENLHASTFLTDFLD